jgi:iron complex outermembrane recepter protein
MLVALGIIVTTLGERASAQETTPDTLPEVKVIPTTPLSTVSPRRRQTRDDSARETRREQAAPTRSDQRQASPRATPAPTPPAPPNPGLIDRSKVPANTDTLTPTDFDHAKSSSLTDALLQHVPSVYINDSSGNAFQPDVQYRGFVASPVVGVPQGLAVYQNGVRVNEVFGDTVNWDFIPDYAIHRLDVLPNNPLFGLNALGGAISIEMKNGFNYQGREAELRAGSFWRRSAMAQVGMQEGNTSFYVGADAINDNGWRQRSPSQLRRIYSDVGVTGEGSEFHLNFTGASNFFGATATTPVQMLNKNWSAVYTTPQTYKNQLAFTNATGSYQVNDFVSIKGNAYFRGFWQKHVDGNTTDVQSCETAGGDQGSGGDEGSQTGLPFFCFGNETTPLISTTGPVPDILNGGVPGSIDRTSTAANAFGGSLQATSTAQLFGRRNQFVVGTSLDQGGVGFKASSELGTIGPDLFVNGTGVIIAQPDGSVAPVNLKTSNRYLGLYVTDTFDLTSQLSVTAGGRFNVAQIELADQLGASLNGSHQFSRFNPVIGATYNVNPWFGTYAGYSEANRAPTPAELACSDPVRPCLLDNFLVADPTLKQVVAYTYEAGFRGNIDLGANNGRLTWKVGAFRTRSKDDIINVASEIAGRGFFQNAGVTRRRGIEASSMYRTERWNIYASYSYIEATFQDAFTLSSPFNPLAVNGLIEVRPGDIIPSIPAHRAKVGAEYAVLTNWKLGADLIAVSGQYLRGDESNLNPMLPGYWIVNLHSTYQISKQLEVFGLVQNLFNHRYYNFGTFFDTTQVPFLGLTDPRTLSPGAPLLAYAGIRGKF